MGHDLGRTRPGAAVAASIVMVLAVLLSQGAHAGEYVGGGTVVYKEEGRQPAADDGAVVCHLASGLGVGGGCIPASDDANAVMVHDALAGLNVAFQVCIDINGDGRCVSGPSDAGVDPCKEGLDLVFFSHDDKGRFFNPLGPLPSGFTRCPDPYFEGPGFPGYVVFLCQGVHATRNEPSHGHPATTGAITGMNMQQSTGFGDFCGGIRDQVIKEYVLV